MLLKLLMEAVRSFGSSDRSDDDSINPLDALRVLRSAGNTLGAQAGLYTELAKIEWAQEKARLARLLVVAAVAFICLFGAVLFAGILILALVWDTEYRIITIAGLLIAYLLGIAIAVWRLKVLTAKGQHAFAATRRELAADIALIKSQL